MEVVVERMAQFEEVESNEIFWESAGGVARGGSGRRKG